MDAAIYARISRDELRDDDRGRLGVTRQLEDCRKEAKRRRWNVVREYVDNDVSASNGKARPEFLRLMQEVDAGRIKGIVVWDADRLSRSPRENEDLIDRADTLGLRLANLGGEIDLSTVQGRAMFRMRGIMARAEVEQQSKRLTRKFQQKAESGEPHGMVAYGYRRVADFNDRGQRVGSHDEVDQEQADVIRETARKLLGGESMRSIVKELNARGVPSPKDKPWTSTTLRQVMLRDRNAGLRTYQGQVIGKATWEPIYDEGMHNRVLALLNDPSRKTTRGGERRHLLSGIARCGICGGEMRVTVASEYRGKRNPAKYQCKACYRVARKQESVDDYVVTVVVERLLRPDSFGLLMSGRPERAQELRDLIGDANARLDLAANEFAGGHLTGAQLRRVNANLMPKISAWTAELATCAPMDGLLQLAGPDAAEQWPAASLDVRRAVIDMLMSVVILPSGPGQKFSGSDDVRITWRS